MASLSTASLVDALRQYRLLEPDQLDQVVRQIKGRKIEPRALAQKLIEHGWLTPYQVNQLLQGRGQDIVLGSYVMLERLGEGGMGQVFKARHRKLGRIVALKLVRKERLANANSVKRFHREIQLAAQLNHPNIVLAFDADQIGETHFFTMELVEGVDLSQLVKKSGPLPVGKACDCIRQAALGLQHAHECGLVHRDIKPSNLLLGSRDGVIKILDMGLARFQGPLGDSDAGQTLTQENAVVGTPDYIAPEQILDASAADIRADLYSLGCTLYYLLTGRVPFPGGSLGEKLVKHQLQEPEPIVKLRPDVPPEVAAVIRRLLAKRPEDRFQTPAELATALSAGQRRAPAAAGGLPQTSGRTTGVPADTVSGVGATRPLWRAVRQRPRLLSAVLGGLFLFVLMVVLMVALQPKDPPLASSGNATPVATPTPTASHRRTEIVNSLKMRLVLIPAGDFVMGSPETEPDRKAHEGPQHAVTISRPYYMGVHEVTVGEFQAFVQASSYQTEGEREGTGAYCYNAAGETVQDPTCNWRTPGIAQTDLHPVTCISRGDAVAFCQWLSKKEGKSYRLPTEAEWEYACRARTTTTYHCGNSLTAAQAHFNATGTPEKPLQVKSVKVGSFPANAFGLHDMHGNVWEWTADSYDPNYYSKSPRQDPPGPPPVAEGVFRGGGFEVGRLQLPVGISLSDVVGVPARGHWVSRGLRPVRKKGGLLLLMPELGYRWIQMAKAPGTPEPFGSCLCPALLAVVLATA